MLLGPRRGCLVASSHQVCLKYRLMPFTAHLPMTAEGSWIYLWTGSGRVIPFHIQCGLILLLHGVVVHSGGNSCHVDHTGTSYPRLYFYLLGSPRDQPGDFVSYINFDGENLRRITILKGNNFLY
jgi:hypothetical protein